MPYNLLAYHRPRPRLTSIHPEARRCIANLAAYRLPKPRLPIPRSKSAAVLVALFAGRHGDLYVLLSRRADTLRMYPGDTALPGGRTDPEDGSAEETARREAFEEIGLPLDRKKAPLLCVLDPFVASNGSIVIPVVVLILDTTLRPILNAAEVTSLFSHPLASFLSTKSPFPADPQAPQSLYYSYNDWHMKGPNNSLWPMRTHQFLTGREAGGVKPIFGLTAAIMIHVATIGYARPPEFELNLPGAPPRQTRLAWTLLNNPEYHEACEKEGIHVDLSALSKLAGVRTRRKTGLTGKL